MQKLISTVNYLTLKLKNRPIIPKPTEEFLSKARKAIEDNKKVIQSLPMVKHKNNTYYEY